MSTPENFVSRWVRLKHEVASNGKTEPGVETPRTSTAVAAEAGPISLGRGNDAAANEASEPGSLPSIEAIAADTDIRGFLSNCVPADLTRNALRRAWASDPAIRDFIGIAESQWDFNDPDAMPGFGPLRGTDDLPGLPERTFGNGSKLAETFAEWPAPREQALSEGLDCKPASLDQSAGRILDDPLAIDNAHGGVAVGSEEGTKASRISVSEADDVPPNRRSHGSALPRLRI